MKYKAIGWVVQFRRTPHHSWVNDFGTVRTTKTASKAEAGYWGAYDKQTIQVVRVYIKDGR